MALVTHHAIVERNIPRSRAEVKFASFVSRGLAASLDIPKDILEAAEGTGKDGALTARDIRRIVA